MLAASDYLQTKAQAQGRYCVVESEGAPEPVNFEGARIFSIKNERQ